MHFNKALLATLALVCIGESSSGLGYSTSTPSTVNNRSLSFGQHYAVLNLDLINAVVAPVNETKAGKQWIHNVASWVKAVHSQSPPPISIYTRIYYSNAMRPEVATDIPFDQVARSFGNLTESSPATQIYPAFTPLQDWDVVLRKSRYYAGAGNSLEEILRAQKIDTVILSGLTTSGVVLATALQLFDLDYNVYVIANNTLETASDAGSSDAGSINDVILQGILPRLPIDIITVEQAIQALKRSGPAIEYF